MNSEEMFAHAKAGLKFCPECGKALEDHPFNVVLRSCFLHGDFRLVWIDGALQVQWSATRMVQAYSTKPTTSPYESLRQRISAANEQTQRIGQVAMRYNDGTISFREATQMITDIETGEYPTEPILEQRRRARGVLNHMLAIRP